ncbi:SbcC/MukB-like Walker B domain-containing protein [Actinoplanes sp. N902-109]|uniref:SbcC/MukB-like Walker B domain-containing protein n=1 Tax=Actinoplanes sp. (strain N902-109) TaxID=649831 RepID=UPI0003293573|nr:SbcC/MukB-like Walker B domain-containing protein [Actinoplanes sp. N902-109]AGL17611.1 hypothetical protein L083_4101 [Actinoplanes sp. N902-109]
MTLPALGPAADDRQLTAWRDALTGGELPAPTRERWQILRAGVVNLWEFDVAEYWFADGRAQFVGANQSGKSTLMALTTLIMLAGDLDRQNIDTFGQSDKAFRYYVEPTDDARDRRDATATTNRGWAWVEYARLGPGGPEFYTTLLYAQAKRGVTAMPPAWLVCRGRARVRDGLQLATGQAVVEPRELAGTEGLTVFDSGRRYAERLATELFGFADTDRYTTVLEMLKVLRTPHLGQRLNPDWFTRQIRSALPPVARTEVAELAEGWQQLEQLRRDRDSAREARDAITAYVTRAWRPWADSVLRLHADELLDADTAVTRAAHDVTAATSRLEQARGELSTEATRTDELLRAARAAQTRYEELLRSKAYLDAAGRADHAGTLRKEAETARRHAGTAAADAARARSESERRAAHRDQARAAARTTRDRATAATEHAAAAATTAGLGDHAPQWAATGDLDRLTAAIATRRSAVAVLRKLLREAATAVTRWEAADDRATTARHDHETRSRTADTATEALAEALQHLSDDLERWSVATPGAPPVPVREQWLAHVTTAAAHPRPRAALRTLVTTDWLDPAITPLTEQIGTLRTRATTADQQAAEAETEATHLTTTADPTPATTPARWTRRPRPPMSARAGGPLWRLVDPHPGTGQATIDALEAALDAAGLLDAWLTPDHTWSPTRDTHDTVLTTATANPPSHEAAAAGAARTLADVLRPAEDAGELAGAVTAVLATIGYAPAGVELAGAVAVSADGRWRTPVAAGQAGAAPAGAELLGVAARVAARRRRIAELRERAGEARRAAEDFRAGAAALTERIAMVRADAAAAPDDADVVSAGSAVAAANAERERAEEALARAEREAARAKRHADDTAAEVAAHAGAHELPLTEERLDALATDLDQAAQAVADLGLALAGRAAADRDLAAGIEAAAEAADAAAQADQRAQDAAVEAEEAVLRAEEASVARDDQEQLDYARTLEKERAELDGLVDASRTRGNRLAEAAAKAAGLVEQRERELAAAHRRRDAALTAWWIPVDAGLAAARDLLTRADSGRPPGSGHGTDAEQSGEEGAGRSGEEGAGRSGEEGAGRTRLIGGAGAERSLAAALRQALAAATTLRPPTWPDAAVDKAKRAQTAMAKAVGSAVAELRTVLEAAGGRSVTIVDADDNAGLPGVLILVDASGAHLAPAEAIRHLDELVAELSAAHSGKLDQIYTELLASTFIDHLGDRVKKVSDLLSLVNKVLERHPTGANRTTLRLRRHPAEGQRAGWAVLRALEDGTIASPAAQEQIREFLGDRVREAQEAGQGSTLDWTEHLAALLDYRSWFDVVAEFRVEGSDFKPLTKQVHGVDSGGGKVVTLLQPLLATLVALYTESPAAPRPLWLDEAFEGVDPGNRATMLRLLVDFDLDFLLAGPAPLVAAAQVPAAAVWIISRAPAPAPGVDLSLMLWAGRTLEQIAVPDHAVRILAPRRPLEEGPDLFTTVDAGDPGDQG